VQRIIKVRRDYNAWVASETMEDYALRFTPARFRRWSAMRVANTAFGASSFLILEAVGATLLVQYGFINAFWAIVATGLIIFLAGLPISVYAARYGVDMDLLTRGAGFGYIGSTITSLIYASFTFIFFALEAAVMAYALELAFDIPPAWGYLVCAVVVLPLVTHGVSVISKLQVWTQPLWLVMLVVPYVAVWMYEPGAFTQVLHYGGESGLGAHFNVLYFGAALTVGIALITQMGEQVDYLRFMPAPEAGPSASARRSRRRWWAAVLLGGPGWVVLGVLKMLGGAVLAYLAITLMVPADRAVDPNQMYLAAYNLVFPDYGWAVAATALFVVVSQLKINVTNAYAGSLAWSNFFSRLTHSHPGRVVWVVFNTFIAFVLMEMNVFQALGKVLGLYSNIAIAWIMAVVADLVVNKPLGLSPRGIEFKRAHLYDINPVGVGAMVLASVLSFVAHLGLMGPMAQAFSALIAMVTAFVGAVLIAWVTQGRYYIARAQAPTHAPERADLPMSGRAAHRPATSLSAEGVYLGHRLQRCVICEREYEGPDMAYCPAYQGPICSLCCTLDARCGDLCKPHARLSVQWSAALRHVLPRRMWPYLDAGLAHYALLMLVLAPLLAAVLGLLYRQETQGLLAGVGVGLVGGLNEGAALAASGGHAVAGQLAQALGSSFMRVYAALLLVLGLVAWWLVLAHKSREVAQVESNRQTELLMQEIESHRRTDEQLQHAREAAERAREAADQARVVAEQARAAADQANQAKTRYISTISHELRTPLNSILGYAQLLHEDARDHADVPPHRVQAIKVIHRGGEHLLSLIEGTLDIARIESGKLTLNAQPMALPALLSEQASLFELQAQAKGLAFSYQPQGRLPDTVRADERRVRQILINLLGNAVKFTQQGSVVLKASYAREMAVFEVVDSGPGMSPADIDRVFEPFARGSTAAGQAQGTGLGLTIAKMLTDLMGGELTVSSQPGQGTTFKVRLFLPEVHATVSAPGTPTRVLPTPSDWGQARCIGYAGPRKQVLVVDNEEADRSLLQRWLAPLGFDVVLATSGQDALRLFGEGLPTGTGMRPHAVFMDLAMPGIDGWETLRRLSAMGLRSGPHAMACAVVSANAFDHGQDNDVGIAPADFFVKPVRRQQLLDWLAQRLSLVWIWPDAAPTQPPALPAAMPTSADRPDAASLHTLLRTVQSGHVRGVQRQLDALARAYPQSGAFVSHARALLQDFRLDELERWVTASTPLDADAGAHRHDHG
jgi:signal transduction histidine kinase/CheY-like chemotaxis protein/purine-cytosine permease-like protein